VPRLRPAGAVVGDVGGRWARVPVMPGAAQSRMPRVRRPVPATSPYADHVLTALYGHLVETRKGAIMKCIACNEPRERLTHGLCSECRNILYHRPAGSATCVQCGKPFRRVNRLLLRTVDQRIQRFCTRACADAARRVRPSERPCGHCGSPFEPARIEQMSCSKSCGAHLRRKRNVRSTEGAS
jgi:hypothetical protein